MSVTSGGQSLISQATAAVIQDRLPPQAGLRDLGEHRLKDLVRPERVFQIDAPDLPADFPRLKSLNAFPHNLPVQLSTFVGRETEIAEARRLLSETHLLTLTGSGGTGKTRLSLQLAAEVLPEYPDGAWVVELAPLAGPAYLVPALAAVFDVRETPGRPLLDVVTDYLRAKHLLLVLDNCEHLIDACARLADDLLHACPGLKLLASSREALGVAGETAYRVPSLALPNPQAATPASLARSEAARLFVERAQAAQPRFALTLSNAPAVAAICWRLDGIPLALELAAARVRVLSVEQILARLDDRFRLLVGGSRTALPRQQTLRALVDWSYDLLPDDERRLLRQMGVFAGGATLEAAEAVGADANAHVLSLLTQLVNKSLVAVDDPAYAGSDSGAARYRLLETIRQYAREKLLDEKGGEAEGARNRHLAFFLQVTEAAEPKLMGAEMIVALDQL
jgi:predicted ATPase